MAKRININGIQRLNGERIFLDTNIWIYLFCPLGDSRDFIVKKYSRAFHHLVKSTNRLYIDVAVLSEFINRYLRLAFQIYKGRNNMGDHFNFKRDYKKTDDFIETLHLVYSIIKNRILPRVTPANISYDNAGIEGLLNDLKQKEIDFNDLHIERLCRENKFFLLTDDGDYVDSDIGIISGNPKLLA